MKLCVIISSLAFALTSLSAFKPSKTPYEIYKTDNMKTCIWYSRDQLMSLKRQGLLRKPKCLVTTETELRNNFEETTYEGFEYRAESDQCFYASSDKKQNCIPFKTQEECKTHCGAK